MTQETPVIDIPHCIQSLATAIEAKMPHSALMSVLTELSDAWNRECDESDKLFDKLEQQETLVQQLNRTNTDLSNKEKLWRDQAEAANRISSRADGLFRNLKVDYDLLKKELEKTARSLEVEKEDHKRTKEQVKRNKETSEKYKTRSNALEKSVAELKKEKYNIEKRAIELGSERLQLINELATFKMLTVWAENGEALMMLPNILSVQIGGQKKISKAYTLLYTDSWGIWRQAAIGSDHRVSFSKIAYSDEVDKEITDTANKALLEPSEMAQKIAQRWLYKVNVVQNSRITDQDLDIRNTANYLREIGELEECPTTSQTQPTP